MGTDIFAFYGPVEACVDGSENLTRNAFTLCDKDALLEAVQKELSKPLNTKDLVPGYNYMFEVDDNDGFVKLRYTTRGGI